MSVKVTVDGAFYTGVGSIAVGGKTLSLESETTSGEQGAAYYVSPLGRCYVENMELNITQECLDTTNIMEMYSGCNKLKSVVMSGVEWNVSKSAIFDGCTALESAIINNVTVYGHYWFRGCTALKTVQLGSVGFPVSGMTLLLFHGVTQSDLTITVYVADDASLPLENAPWGATNATIVYKSATSGETITV